MIELLVLGATLTIAAWATGADAHRRGAASRALERYAHARGLRFAPAPRSPRGASPRAAGEKDGIPHVIDLYRLGGEVRTRVSTNAPRGRAAILSVSQRGAFAWKTGIAIQLGEPAFDRAYLVVTGAPEDADVLRDAARSLLLLDRLGRQGVWLRSDGQKVTLSWRGPESDPLVLDAAREAVVAIGSRHRPDAPYR